MRIRKRLALALAGAVIVLLLAAFGGSTRVATNIGTSSATLNGTWRCDAGRQCTARFEYRWVHATAWTLTPSRNFSAGTHTVSMPITGLNPSTTYQFKICGTQSNSNALRCFDSIGTVNPPNNSPRFHMFTTRPPPPPPPPMCVTSGRAWCGDFSTGNISQYTQLLGRPASRVSVVRSGNAWIGRVELRPEDRWTDNTNRMTLREARGTFWGEGADVYYRIDLYISRADDLLAVPQPTNTTLWRSLFSWPTNQAGNCSNGGFNLERISGTGALSRTGTPALVMAGNNCNPSSRQVYWWLHNPIRGRWYEFIIRRFYSNNASRGVQTFWLKRPGQTAFHRQRLNGPAGGGRDIVHFRTLGCSGCTANLRLGIYRTTGFRTTDWIFYADVRSTTSFAAASR